MFYGSFKRQSLLSEIEFQMVKKMVALQEKKNSNFFFQSSFLSTKLLPTIESLL